MHGAVIAGLHTPAMHDTGRAVKFRHVALAAIAVSFGYAGTARADLACGSLLMPAGQLKQVSRGVSAHHSGLDLISPQGSPLRAAAGGTVVAATQYFAYGLMVDIAHGNGVVTRYAHMSAFAPGIRPGAAVAAGQLIGQVGRTGRASTPHVHFEVRIAGRPVDPKPYLSLATCTARTPGIRFDEAQARPAAQVAAAPPLAARRIDGRPGGLLE